MKESIEKFDLDLSGQVVLTEAATGNFVCTPIIAALANAKKVYVYAKDTHYGTAEENFENTNKLARHLNLEENIIFLKSLDAGELREVDIVTNLGPLRPINGEFIKSLKETAVIPLMRETWEFREGEIDLAACREGGIVVMGTNENHPDLRIFDYLGHLCAKKLFENDIEIFKSKILVLGGGEFGNNISKYLEKMGAEIQSITDIENMNMAELDNLDALIITTYPAKELIIGDEGIIKPQQIAIQSPGTLLLQFKGNISREDIIREGLDIIPKNPPKLGHMSWTLNDLGPKPVIDLHTAGLKVGEIMAKIRNKGNSPKMTIEKALMNNLVQDFSDEQKKEYFT